MDRFNQLQAFIKVVDRGGFAGAARDLGVSPSSVTRAVAALEDRLGTGLLIRTTRAVRLTDSGRRFLESARQILVELEEAEDAAVGTHTEPSGELRITAPVLLGRMVLTPIIGEYLERFPRVRIQTLFVDRNVNLIDEGLDVAVRIGELPDSSLIAIKAGSVRLVAFASPDYLAANGEPEAPEDLSAHRLIQSLPLGTSAEWPFQRNGKQVTVHIEPQARMNTNDAVIELAVRGFGCARLLSYQIAPYVSEKRLKIILVPFELSPLPVHIIHQEGRTVSAKVRSFVDFAVERLRANPSL